MKALFVLLTVLGILPLLGGCRTKKSLRKESSFIRMDSLSRIDSEIRQAVMGRRLDVQQHTRIRQIELSVPDSLQRQYVRSVTFTEAVQAMTDSVLSIKEVSLLKTEECSGMEIIELREQRTVNRSPVVQPAVVWLLWIVFIYWILKKMKVWDIS